jgi:hypothetical protein
MDAVLLNLHDEIFRCRKEGDAAGARLKLSKSALMTCTKKLKILSKEKTKLEGENTKLRSENRVLKAEVDEAKKTARRMGSELEAAKRQIAELQEQVQDNALLLERIASTEQSRESLSQKLSDSQRLVQKLMQKLKVVSDKVCQAAGSFSFLSKEHSGDYAQLFGLDSAEIQESMTRLFRMLVTPVSHAFHAKLFGISDEHSQDANTALASLKPASQFLNDTCDKSSPMWTSLRRALMDHWELNHWDLMQIPTHTQIQLVSIYFENKIRRLEAWQPAPAAQAPAAPQSAHPFPLRLAFVSMFSLPQVPAALPSEPTVAMRILGRLEMLACRHNSPWAVSACIILPNDSPIIADSATMAFLELNGIRAFHSPSGGYVMRFFTIPCNQRRAFASEGFTLGQIFNAGVPGSACKPGSLEVETGCMHTSDLVDALCASMGPDFSMADMRKCPDNIQAAHLMRLCMQFILTTPHIAVYRLVTTFRQYMMEKHQAMILDFGRRELVALASELKGSAKDSELPCPTMSTLPKFQLPMINLPARVVRIPPVFKTQLIAGRLQGVIRIPPVTRLAKALTLSRCIHIRAYINYHNEPNVDSMDDMEPWVDMMNTAEAAGFDEHSSPPRLPRFKFGYARTMCIGFHIHAFVMCPSPLRHALSISALALDACHLVEMSIGKQLNMVVPVENMGGIVNALYNDRNANAMHVFFEDVIEALRRAVQSDYLIFFGDREDRVGEGRSPAEGQSPAES